MASLGISPDELRALEQTRQRLFQLTTSIQSLRADVLKSNPLPPPNSLHASSEILLRNLQSLHSVMTENAHLFQRLAVHPSTNYPGRTQEGILLQLLRKKPEPDVEAWFEEGREMASRLELGGSMDELRAVWDEIKEWWVERAQEYIVSEYKDVYTAEERALGVENVRTGLRRALEEDGEDEEEDDDDDDVAMADSSAEKASGGGNGNDTVLPEFLLAFEVKGDFDLPQTLEYESRKADAQGGKMGRV